MERVRPGEFARSAGVYGDPGSFSAPDPGQWSRPPKRVLGNWDKPPGGSASKASRAHTQFGRPHWLRGSSPVSEGFRNDKMPTYG